MDIFKGRHHKILLPLVLLLSLTAFAQTTQIIPRQEFEAAISEAWRPTRQNGPAHR